MKTAANRLTTVFLLVTSILLSYGSAAAVENGDLADGSEYVVPITIQASPSTWQGCSGAVIAPTIIATAGHCVLDQTGLLSSQIYVGNPGSPNSPTLKWAKVTKVYLSDEYRGNKVDGTVAASDVAFLLLERAITSSRQIYLASENELLALKNTSAKLRIIGYGNISDSGDRSISPFSFDSTFSKQNSADPNQALTISQKANTCKGDSGAPVLSISPNKVTLVGVVTGSNSSNFCSKRQSDGTYLTAFTAINRFANLATEAINDALKAEQAQNSTAIQSVVSNSEELRTRISELELENSNLTDELAEIRQQLDKSNKIIAAFKASGQTAITCSNLISSKMVVGKNPKCPKGFKKE
jgi:secreted trypsin-like serine protease